MPKTKTEPVEKMPVSRKIKAWEVFAQYIKLRDSVEGWGQCGCCGKWTNIYTGYAFRLNQKDDSASFLNEKNASLVCRVCFWGWQGKRAKKIMAAFREGLINKYDLPTVEEIEKMPVRPWCPDELLKLTRDYRNKIKLLGGYCDK